MFFGWSVRICAGHTTFAPGLILERVGILHRTFLYESGLGVTLSGSQIDCEDVQGHRGDTRALEGELQG